MMSLAEMATYLPIAGAFTQYASRFVDPSLGFAMGWIYWFSWSITYALELSAAGLIVQWWNQDLNLGVVTHRGFTIRRLKPLGHSTGSGRG